MELMVALAIGGFISLALMQMGSIRRVVQKKNQERLDLVQLRASIHQRISCGPTVDAVCRAGIPRLISTKADLGLAHRLGARHVELRPYCRDGGVYVNYTYIKNGALDRDVVTNALGGYRPLFPGPLCVSQTPPDRGCRKGGRPNGYDFDTKRYTCLGPY